MQFSQAFIAGTQELLGSISELVATDGKRRTMNGNLPSCAYYICVGYKQNIVLIRIKIDKKANEITASPQLFALLMALQSQAIQLVPREKLPKRLSIERQFMCWQ